MCLPVRRRLVADEVSDIEKTRVKMTLLNLVASWIFAVDSTCDVGMPDYGKGFDTNKPEVSKGFTSNYMYDIRLSLQYRV